MHTHADSSQDIQSLSASDQLLQTQQKKESQTSSVLGKNSPRVVAQRKLFTHIARSPRVRQLKAAQDHIRSSSRIKQFASLNPMSSDYSQAAPPTLQRQENRTGLPDSLKQGVENLSGYAMDDVKVHYNSDKPAQLNAHAYAQGTNIHLGPGQEKHLPHEAWHVVQQKQGRVKPTKQKEGKRRINDDPRLEQEADAMGIKALESPLPQTVLLKSSSNSDKGVVQRMLKEFHNENGQTCLRDSETGEIYEFAGTTGDGTRWFQNSKSIIGVDSGNVIIEKNDVPQTTSEGEGEAETGDMEMDPAPPARIEPKAMDEGVVLDPMKTGAQELRKLKKRPLNPTKLTTNLSVQIALVPIDQGILKGRSRIAEYTYHPGQIAVKSIQMGDLDRPQTRFKNQESHTVAWTLVRNGIMGYANQSLSSFCEMIIARFHEIGSLVQNEEGKRLYGAVVKNEILSYLKESNYLQIDVWQRLTSKLLVSYLQVYQLSRAATYKRGKALGHGESQAMKSLREYEDRIIEGPQKEANDLETISSAAETLLDVQFSPSLGARAYAFAIKEWVQQLQAFFPHLMYKHQDGIVQSVMNKELSPSFKKEIGADENTSSTVSDLLGYYGYAPGTASIRKDMGLPTLSLQQVELETLRTNFVANVSLVPDQQGVPSDRDSYSTGPRITDMFYPYSFLTIHSIQISDNDRPKTKFIQNQKSHTVPWTLTRRSLNSFQGKTLTALLKYLLIEFQKLRQDIAQHEGLEVANSGIALISENEQEKRPIDAWQEIISELVRKYAIAYQVAESTAYINPREAERALGHGEGTNMAVLTRNEYALNSFGGVLDKEVRLLQAIKGMFDAEVTPSLTQANIKQAFLGMAHKLTLSFPSVCQHYLDTAITEMKTVKMGDHLTLGDILADSTLDIDTSGFLTLSEFDPFKPGVYGFSENDLVDENGNVNPSYREVFKQAYRNDIAQSHAYLTEGEGNIAAQNIGICVQVFEGQLPQGYVRVENMGGGDCLIHALAQAYHLIHNPTLVPPIQAATPDDIQRIRTHISQNIEDGVLENLITTAVQGQILGIPEPGLGPNMRKMLAHPSLTAAARIQEEKNASSPGNPGTSSSSSSMQQAAGAPQPPAPQAVASFGNGTPHPKIALLHIGAHYVMIYQASG